MDETSGVALALQTGVPTYQVEDEEGRTHLLIHLPIEEEDEGDGVSGGPITRALIRGSFSMMRWLRNKKMALTKKPLPRCSSSLAFALLSESSRVSLFFGSSPSQQVQAEVRLLRGPTAIPSSSAPAHCSRQ
jgi:hypothetical protein